MYFIYTAYSLRDQAGFSLSYQNYSLFSSILQTHTTTHKEEWTKRWNAFVKTDYPKCTANLAVSSPKLFIC